MANVLITDSLVSKESLKALHNNIIFTKVINRQFEKKWGTTDSEFGSTFNVRLPNKYTVRDGMGMQTQGQSESSVPVTLNIFKGVDMDFTGVDLTVAVDLKRFAERYITPAQSKLSATLDSIGMALPITSTYNQVGTPGTTPGTAGGAGLLMTTAPNIFLNAGAVLDNNAVPESDRYLIVNPIANANCVSGLSALFNPAQEISDQFRRGRLVDGLGLYMSKSQNVNSLTNGTHAGSATAQVTVAGQTGSSILITGLTPSSNNVIAAGEVIQFAGVHSVNPETQTVNSPFGALGNFVVTSAVNTDASGNATVNISPPIIPVGAAVANGTTDIAPSAGAAITLMSGAANTSYPVNVAFHKDAYTFVSAELYMPKTGVEWSGRETYENFSVRMIRSWDITSEKLLSRIDVLCGYAKLRPEMAVRING